MVAPNVVASRTEPEASFPGQSFTLSRMSYTRQTNTTLEAISVTRHEQPRSHGTGLWREEGPPGHLKKRCRSH